jgi:diadenosine tetraphosphatase ApaH/serine/threonine PP2A family protein phosphatase
LSIVHNCDELQKSPQKADFLLMATNVNIKSLFGENALPEDEFVTALRGNAHIDETVFTDVLHRLVDQLCVLPNVLYLSTDAKGITVVGDIHGQILDLFKMFEEAGGFGHGQRYLFLGDYVDRGYSSLETFIFLAYLKVKYQDEIFLLRGNHESRAVNQQYGLYNETSLIYGYDGLWTTLNDAFDYLPVAAVIDNRIFAVHGGLTPRIPLICYLSWANRVQEIDEEPIAGITWSDPMNGDGFVPNTRGKGYSFGPDQTRKFVWNNKLGDSDNKDSPNHGFVARAHQMIVTGYEWTHADKLVTVWSAPNYAYKQVNKASIMKIDENGALDFKVFDAHQDSAKKPPDGPLEYFA